MTTLRYRGVRGARIDRNPLALLGVVLLFSIATVTNAQVPQSPLLLDILDINLGLGEQIAGGFVGVGARAMGMGGAHVAAVNDGSALFWNPAALTRVRRTEFLGGLAQLKSSPTTTVDAGTQRTSDVSSSFTRLNSVVIAAPYPVYRGGMTFAFGATRPDDYAYRSLREGRIPFNGKQYDLDDSIRKEGGIRQYAIGMGLEVSPSVSVGGSFVWYRGTVDIRRDITFDEVTTSILPDELEGLYKENTTIAGFMTTLGATAQLPHDLTIGLVATPPVTYRIEGTWAQKYEEAIGEYVDDYPYKQYSTEYAIKAPWRIGTGFSWSTYALSISGDVWYQDWTQARYTDGSPFDEVAEINEDSYFEDRYDSVVRWHVGMEALIPWIGTMARAGYYSDPDPFSGPALESGEDVVYNNSAGFVTLGLGWLIDDTVALDLAYITGGDEVSNWFVREERSTSRLISTIAFRF
jgi:long-subunit fatty acid transport protein